MNSDTTNPNTLVHLENINGIFRILNSTWTTTLFTILQNGNVGIGTTTPGAALHIAGTSGATLKIVDGNQAAGKVLTSDANGQASWQTASAGGGSGAFNGIQRFTSTTTWTIPAGITKVKVTAVGGGGGGSTGTYICCSGYYNTVAGSPGSLSSLQGCTVQGGAGGGAPGGVIAGGGVNGTTGVGTGSLTYTAGSAAASQVPHVYGYGSAGAAGGSGGNGGSGGIGIGICTVTPGDVLTVTVGTAGAGGGGGGAGSAGMVLLEW